MTAFRCLICGSRDEPGAGRCRCGAFEDVTAGEARRVLRRTLRAGALETAGAAILLDPDRLRPARHHCRR